MGLIFIGSFESFSSAWRDALRVQKEPVKAYPKVMFSNLHFSLYELAHGLRQNFTGGFWGAYTRYTARLKCLYAKRFGIIQVKATLGG